MTLLPSTNMSLPNTGTLVTRRVDYCLLSLTTIIRLVRWVSFAQDTFLTSLPRALGLLRTGVS